MKNINKIKNNLKEIQNKRFKINELTDLTKIYKINEEKFKIHQNKIFHQVINDDVLVLKENGNKFYLSPLELFEIISNFKFQGKKTVYFPNEKIEKSSKINNNETIKFLKGYFTKSKSMKVQINKKIKLFPYHKIILKNLYYLMQLILIYGH